METAKRVVADDSEDGRATKTRKLDTSTDALFKARTDVQGANLWRGMFSPFADAKDGKWPEVSRPVDINSLDKALVQYLNLCGDLCELTYNNYFNQSGIANATNMARMAPEAFLPGNGEWKPFTPQQGPGANSVQYNLPMNSPVRMHQYKIEDYDADVYYLIATSGVIARAPLNAALKAAVPVSKSGGVTQNETLAQSHDGQVSIGSNADDALFQAFLEQNVQLDDPSQFTPQDASSGVGTEADEMVPKGVMSKGWIPNLLAPLRPSTNWVGYVAISQPDSAGFRDIAVAFRGTQAASEWGTDFHCKKVLWDYQDGSCQVHAGFDTLYRGIRRAPDNTLSLQHGGSLPQVDGHRSMICCSCQFAEQGQVHIAVRKLLAKYPNQVRSITTTGHSLGGALASLCAFDLWRSGINRNGDVPRLNGRDERIPITAVTFEAPRVGDEKYAAHFSGTETLGPRLLRVVNQGDKVPQVPPNSFGFVHGGVLLFIDASRAPGLKPVNNGRLMNTGTLHNLQRALYCLDPTRPIETLQADERAA